MNDRRIRLAVTLAAVLGTPIAAGAQEQPELPDAPKPPDQAQTTAPDQTKKVMATTTSQTPPTVEPAAAIEFSRTSGQPLRVVSGPPNFAAPRRVRPAPTPITPTPTAQSIPSKQPTVATLSASPAPSASPALSTSSTERLPAIEFSAPRPAPAVRPALAQSTPTVVPEAAPLEPATDPQSPQTQSPQTQPLQDQLSTLEQRQQQLEREIERLKQDLAGSKTAPAVSIAEDRDQNFSISATGVFFKPRNTNPFTYAVEDAGNALALNGKLQTAEYDRGAGFRVGLSYQPPNSALDVAVAYTSLNTSGSDQAIAPTNGFLFSTLSHPRQNERAGSANATVDLDYNNTDLELGYKFRVGKSLALRLFGGLKFAAVNQSATANYNQIDLTQGRIQVSNDFSGVGPRLGAEARVLLGSGFSLFGRGAASLLIGDLTSSYRETDNNGANLVANVQNRQGSHTVPVLEAAIGLDWQAALGKRTKLNLSAGYEYQQWFNTSDDLRFVNASNPGLFTRSSGDLSLSGFFVKGALSFEF